MFAGTATPATDSSLLNQRISQHLSFQLHGKTVIQNGWPREGSIQPQGRMRSCLYQFRSEAADSIVQFTAKQLNRQAAKANKDEQTEKAKLKKV